MDKKIDDFLKSEVDIPDVILKQLTDHRQRYFTKDRHQIAKINKKLVVLSLLAAIVTIGILISQKPVRAAILTALGINQDSAVKVVEDQNISTKLNLRSVQNNREITVTKFVSTKKKFAFDYQFKLDDPTLKKLLSKTGENQASPPDIRLSLFEEGNPNDLFGGVTSYGTYYVKDGVFYGSEYATFMKNKISDNAKLTLHINSLSWRDKEKLNAAKNKSISEGGTPFTMIPDVKYEGDWQYKIKYKPILTTKSLTVSNLQNVSVASATSDALQTTIKFKTTALSPNTTPDISMYKNGLKLKLDSLVLKPDNGYEAIFNLSALDKSKDTYTVQLNEFNANTQTIGKKVASFEVK